MTALGVRIDDSFVNSARLLSALDSAGPSAEFCTEGTRPPVLPGLVVRGLGEVGLPVSAAEAKRLVSKGVQAPYGRGEETIVDTKVRRVWQLEPRQFTLTNPAWAPFLDGVVDAVGVALGITHDVQYELYKLLVYEKGSFFAPHRDTEKREGMFATLVVSLPSRHEGGTLVVTHDGESRRIELGGGDSGFEVRYAAFYADCQHEVLPVRSGYRVCLVYNLSIARKSQPKAPNSTEAVAAASKLLGKLFEDPALDKIAVTLKHQYSDAALEPDALKGADRARFAILARSAEQLDYELHLALMTHHQAGQADEESVYRGRYRSRRRYHDDEDHDGEDDDALDGGDGDGAEFAEVDEESLTLDSWRDRGGLKVPLGRMKLDESEIVSDVEPAERPYRTEVHEATGNEGVSMDRWYHQAVVVLWPKDRVFRILANEGPQTAVPALERLVAETREPEKDDRCKTLAEAIVEAWPPGGRGRRWSEPDRRVSAAGPMLKLLGRIGSFDLAARFVREVLPDELDGSEGTAVVRLAGKAGWAAFLEPLRAVLARQAPDRLEQRLAIPVTFFTDLCRGGVKPTSDRRAACRDLAAEMENVVDRFDRNLEGAWWATEETRAGIVESLFRAFVAIGDVERLERLVSRVLSNPSRYDLHAVVIPAVKALAEETAPDSPTRPAWNRLHESCVAQLRERIRTKPEPPRDLSREAAVECKCTDCHELNTFLRDPKAEVHLFPRRKELRQHLHMQIEHHKCDLTHETTRRGSPYTLVCRKTRASYERRLAQFELDSRLLKEL